MRVLFAAGGTGGHIYPALALARHLCVTEGAETLFVGTERGLEKELVPAAGFELEKIPAAGLERRVSLQAGKALLLAGAGVWSAARIVRSFRPNVVVGMGGYVSGPVVLAAVLAGTPAVIHEQNAVPGLTNVLLSRMARRVCLSFPGSERHFPPRTSTILTGNPRASEALQAAAIPGTPLPGLLPGVPVLLAVGGTHGAARLNEVFAQCLEPLLAACEVQVVYITGRRYFAAIKQLLEPLGNRFPHRLHLLPYHPALPQLLARTALIVSRAGATTCAEITALGVPAVLVPSPNVTNNHQEHNALVLTGHGAALLIREAELNSAGLTASLAGLLRDRDKLRRMSVAGKGLGFPEAAAACAAVIHEVV
ncbi:MAG: UDP-N-acetylglucosamine--N-acetylmuramyl-(pentapeptide) pyrophosphoryl-undecaprenol N-acetylglucosamine transferase [Syntrophomonadaceae bacterium]|nr:UDP-N-acetylglucosamine--N-acetylmuramyl-(pentapeptide) pyrophosphoryl-undecaprenol N-acetylglucosamine transferase [Bacillota bacterium]